MGEADMEVLKAKCNALIDKALQKKKESEELDLKIEQLQEVKRSMEERLDKELHPDQEEETENIEGCAEENDMESELQVSKSQEDFSANYHQILQMLQDLSSQSGKQQEDVHVRKVSSKEKIWVTVQDVLGKIGKLFLTLLCMAVLSLAATIALNEQLRNMFMDILKACFG